MSDSARQAAPMDRYMVMEYLAEGGMGAIYLGKKLGAGGFEKQVVLKQLLPEFTQQPEFIDLFLREARLSASLDHANIIHTIDLVTAGEEYFIVMEYLDGADLRTLTRRAKRRHKRIAPGAGLYIGRELLSALAYAHGKLGPDGKPLGLIHRDVSPSNILISGSGEVKLTDFGIAKASTHNSIFYRVKGKVGYMSPEQARSEELDHRSDLYSLAVCLYEVLTGERLFVNAGLTTSADEMYSQPVPAVSSKVPGLPRELDELMFRALAVDPAERFQSAGEFQENLLRCAHRHQLLMSGPELADHLREACGSPAIWRDEDNLGDDVEVADREGTEQLAIGPTSSSGGSDELLSVAEGGSSPINESRRRKQRTRTSVTKLTWLQGMELTSMIKLDGGPAGAEPLFDVENLGRDADPQGDASRLVELGATSTGFDAVPPPDHDGGDEPALSPSQPPPPASVGPVSYPAQIPARASAPARERAGIKPVWASVALLLIGGAITAGIGFTGPSLEIPDELVRSGAPEEAASSVEEPSTIPEGEAGDEGEPAGGGADEDESDPGAPSE